MTQSESIDISEVLLCARYGELDELKTEVQRLIEQHSGSTPQAILARANDSGNTALHMASANGHADIVSYLLEHLLAMHVNAANAQGNTPLHWGAVNGHEEIVSLLIKAGADLLLTNAAKKTPLIEAQDAGHEKVAVELLKHMDPDMDEDAEDATEEKHLRRLLLHRRRLASASS
ncbi:ankyrin repeat-containing domain protein [Catenaria anguillulae PL171]|uniref:Ankyrin repeat-containing domain protein n=1 Tax=Catenaria anguillulae PL171 TaxID=765915 RepID=A0A1Y2HQT1_9FUNG|nr:ankyrin repeat-containing domain protein [Catenaria anguillulae PL171]